MSSRVHFLCVILVRPLQFEQGLNFDLVVHNPLWALRGHLLLFDEWRQDSASSVPPQLSNLSSSAMRGAAEAAQGALLSIAATDAVLLVAPGALALGAMRIGFEQARCASMLVDLTQRMLARILYQHLLLTSVKSHRSGMMCAYLLAVVNFLSHRDLMLSLAAAERVECY